MPAAGFQPAEPPKKGGCKPRLAARHYLQLDFDYAGCGTMKLSTILAKEAAHNVN
jgi:hypothetical protein